MRLIPDKTGRFSCRPFFEDGELDLECDRIITQFLTKKYGCVKLPICTEDLKCLLETKADLDLYVTLNQGEEGKTDFRRKKPDVHISEILSSEARYENRLRTTLAHEFGHVHFHGPFYEMKKAQLVLDFFGNELELVLVTYRSSVITASETDWLEWQAGYVSGALLMPISHVKPRVLQYLGQHGTTAVSLESPLAQNLIQKASLRYQVSAVAARVRLQQLGYIVDCAAVSVQGELL
ncbi:MAG: ImmA/IrrE family metallo-endopeptidase [Armatimonadetes bacterium]|nr:ImmA/IrrE family metallo-endopeptidase [Armatimonadota bacterium]